MKEGERDGDKVRREDGDGDLWEQGSNGGGCEINKINRPMANAEPKGNKE